MNGTHGFDRAVDEWLEDGSDATPPEVIDAVLLAVRSTPQERDFHVPWRSTTMTTYLRVAAVIALAVIGTTAAIWTLGTGGRNSGGPSATTSPGSALLALGTFLANDGAVELAATGEGASVTGRMTVSVEGDYAFTVDLQCTRTTEDGLLMIGGVTIDSTSRHVSAEGTWAGIVLEPATPVEAAIWSHRGGPPSEAASCLAFLDEQLLMEECCRNSEDPPDWLSPIQGSVEFGP